MGAEALGWADLIIGLVFGVIGFVLAVAFRWRRARLVFQSQGLTLIEGPLQPLADELRILYRGEPVDRVSITRIIFWNDTPKVIRDSDIAEPIRCRVEGGRILSARVLKTTRKSIKFRVERSQDDGGGVYFRFAFLNENDGALIELVHTSAEMGPTITGVIQDAPGGIKDLGRISRAFSPDLIEDRFGNPWIVLKLGGMRLPVNLDTVTFLVYLTIVGVAAAVIVTGDAPALPPLESTVDWIWRVLLVLFGLLAFVVIPVLLARWVWRDRQRFPRDLSIREE